MCVILLKAFYNGGGIEQDAAAVARVQWPAE